MPSEPPAPTPALEPRESGVDPSQQAPSADAAALVRVVRPEVQSAIGQSELAAAIREIGTTAPQILVSRWAEDSHRRLDRREQEVANLRDEISTLREDRARLDERLKTIGKQNAAQDLLKVAGGAVIALGLTVAWEGRYFLGGVITILGALLAYFGGATIPGLRRNG